MQTFLSSARVSLFRHAASTPSHKALQNKTELTLCKTKATGPEHKETSDLKDNELS